MATAEQRIRDFYGFPFPDDFFAYREFLAKLPPNVLGESCDLWPAFPFKVADGQSATEFPDHPLWEDRFYHDLPEFLTLFTGGTDGLHFGYVFDSPGHLPPIVAHYYHSDTFEHAFDGDTIFEATRSILENCETDFLELVADDPDEAEYYESKLEHVKLIRRELSVFWGADRTETGSAYSDSYRGSKWREPVAKTWDRLGIVVPRELYRPLSADPFQSSPVDIKRPEINALISAAEGQLKAGLPGAALKLGRDLWVLADKFPECYPLLDAAYAALGREPLRKLLVEAKAWRQRCDANRR